MAVKDVIQNYSINQNSNKMKYIAKLLKIKIRILSK